MDYGLKFTPQDYTAALMQIGQNFGNAYQRQRLGSALSGPGSMDEKVQKLLSMGRVDEATKLLTANSLANYRGIQGEVAQTRAETPQSLDQQIYDDFKAGRLPGQGPSMLGPNDKIDSAVAAEEAEASGSAPSGVPGVSMAQNSYMPNVIAQKLLSPEELKRRQDAGGYAADAAEHDRKRGVHSEHADAVMGDLLSKIDGVDDDTLEYSLGPLEGNDPVMQGNWTDILRNVPQQYGAAMNGMFGGGKNTTYEVRDMITGSMNALSNSMKSFVKVKGDVWSDKDQALLDSVFGNLKGAQTRDEFNRRFNNAVDRINSAFGMRMKIRAPDARDKKHEARLDAEGGENPVAEAPSQYPQPRKVTTVPIGPAGEETASPAQSGSMTPGADPRRITKAWPTPPAKAKNALKAYYNNPQYREEAIRKFEGLYGPGSVELYLGLGGR